LRFNCADLYPTLTGPQQTSNPRVNWCPGKGQGTITKTIVINKRSEWIEFSFPGG